MDEILLRLTSKHDNADFASLMDNILSGSLINLNDFSVNLIDDIILSFKDKIIEEITENGLFALIETEKLNEKVVGVNMTANQIVNYFHKFLDKIQVDEELIIIDPYFFPQSYVTSYLTTIEQILCPYLPIINTIIFITKGKYSTNTFSTVESLLKGKKASLDIQIKTSEDYHDRFWITNKRSKGIITGSSLNGLGKKYAIIDRLKVNDVKDIVQTLMSGGLIT